MEEATGSEDELASGYKLVPWPSWDQWNLVRESIFSSDPASVAVALRRVVAWRSRGCLPVAIDVTAAFVEIQHKDPYFRDGISNDALVSEEMLAMLYCMAIMRLVNGFVEPMHKRTGRSISELADAIGIPQMLVDIRHEGSHRDLPSIRLVRLACMKALDWLKSNYWEPQRNAIPDVRKEIRSRLHEMIFYLKTRHVQRLSSSQTKGRRCTKHISKISKIISRLYSAYPSEVASVLLEFIHLHASDLHGDIHMEKSDDSGVGDPGHFVSSVEDLKIIINRLSKKRPKLLLSILKMVLEMIEVNNTMRYENGDCCFLSSQYKAKIGQIEHLCSLVPWLLMTLKGLKDSGQVRLLDETQGPFVDKSAAPKVSLVKFLRKCITLSTLGNKHLSDSVLLLADMIGESSLTERLRKLPLPGSRDMDSTECCGAISTESIPLQEEDSLKQAAEELEHLKLRLRNCRCPDPAGLNRETSNKWNVAKSWIPCPIGMLPCSFSSTPVPSVLDKVDNGTECKKDERIDDKVSKDHVTNKREASHDIESLEDESPAKKSRETPEFQKQDPMATKPPMEGRLLVDGVWKMVSEEELLAIQSNIRIFIC